MADPKTTKTPEKPAEAADSTAPKEPEMKPDGKPPEPKVPESAAVDPIFSILHSDLGVKIEDGKIVRGPFPPKKEPAQEPEKKPDEAEPAKAPEEVPPEKPEEPKAEEKPVVEVATEADENDRLNQRLSEVVDKALDKRLPKEPAKAEKPKTEAPADPDTAYIEALSEDWKYEISLAKLAEKTFGSKGKVKETIAFSKAIDEYVSKHKDDEGRTFDESDEDYQRFLRSKRPKYSPTERRRLEVLHELEPQIKEAKREVRAEMEPKMEAAEDRNREQEAKPRIATDLKKFNENLLTLDEQADPLLKETVALVKDKGEAAIDEDPVYGSIVLKEVRGAEVAAAEFLALSNGLKKVDLENNPLHKYLFDFMESQGQYIATNGAELRNRKLPDGTVQTFLPRSTYVRQLRADPDKTRREHFTFTDQDVLDMLAINAKALIGQQVKTANEKLTKAGYGRQKPPKAEEKPANPPAKASDAAPPPAKPAAKQPNRSDDEPDPASPKVGGAPAPGAAQKGSVSAPSLFSERDRELLVGKK